MHALGKKAVMHHWRILEGCRRGSFSKKYKRGAIETVGEVNGMHLGDGLQKVDATQPISKESCFWCDKHVARW